MGGIQRSTSRDTHYDQDDFVVRTASGSEDLVLRPDWGSDYFGAKIETQFSKYLFNRTAETWEVTAKDGTKYFYGSTAASRQSNEHGIFKWCLDRVEDTNGNYMTISYSKDQGQIYLKDIQFTGNGSLPTTKKVVFSLEGRPDVYSEYISNAEIVTAKRLRTISTMVDGELVRAYLLDYGQTGKTGQSLLSGIQEFGGDVQSALPPHSIHIHRRSGLSRRREGVGNSTQRCRWRRPSIWFC